MYKEQKEGLTEEKKLQLKKQLDAIIRMANECKGFIDTYHERQFDEEFNSVRYSMGIEESGFNNNIFPYIRIKTIEDVKKEKTDWKAISKAAHEATLKKK